MRNPLRGIDPAKLARYTAVALIVAGFMVLVFGWYGTARLDHVPGQIPYIISGGMIGLGLVAAGLTVVLVQESRRDRLEIGRKLDEILDSIHRSQLAASFETNGHAKSAEDAGDLVVAGRTAYHIESCRLVEGRPDVTMIPRDAAEAQGLSPCRICVGERAET